MADHTPGPWTVILRGERGTFHVPEAQRHEADESDDGLDGYTISKSNARLISAAPELLEALKVARNNLQFLPPDDVVEQIDAAIAKAEGCR